MDGMDGVIVALHRYPIKGFTPEPVESAMLEPGQAFPCDRLFAVENGPSGFDPDKPGFIPKGRFTVLARGAAVATVRTRYDESSGSLSAIAPEREPFREDLQNETGRAAFAAWLTPILADEMAGPLRMIDGRGHRFLDDPAGHVSVLNLASARDLERRIGAPVDPLRFRANIHVEGWEPWAENASAGRRLRLGTAEARVLRPITRCAATEVDPETALRDLPIPADLHRLYGHVWCGVYVQVAEGGSVAVGQPVSVI